MVTRPKAMAPFQTGRGMTSRNASAVPPRRKCDATADEPAVASRWLHLADVGRLQPFRAARDLELDLITLGQALEALGRDRAEVHEHVLAALLCDEAKTLRIVEPLHST